MKFTLAALLLLVASAHVAGCAAVRTTYSMPYEVEPTNFAGYPPCHSVMPTPGTICTRCDDTPADRASRPIPTKCLRTVVVTWKPVAE